MSESPATTTGRKAQDIIFDANNFLSVTAENNSQTAWSESEPFFVKFLAPSSIKNSHDSFIYTDPETVQALTQKFGGQVSNDETIQEKQQEIKPPPPTAAVPAPPEAIADTNMALAVCLVPDVCLTPIGNSVVPIPYQVYGRADDDDNYSPDVFFNGYRAMRFDSLFFRTYGDEPGVALGVISGTVADKVEPTSHSTIVRINGHYAVRHGDSCTLNSGNTPGEMLFVQNTMIADPPQGHVGDAEQHKEKENEKQEKPQYQRPSERGVGPSLTGGGTRTIGEEGSKQRNPDGTRESSHTLHNDKRETAEPSAEYEFFNEKVGVVKDKLLVDGKNGNVQLNVFTVDGKASASAEIDKDKIDLGVSASAAASSVKVEGTAGNDYVSGNASLEGPAARIGGEAGVRISKDSVTAKLEGEIGASLLEGELGLDLATPTFFGWGVYVACEASGGVGLGAKGIASFDTQGKRKGGTLGVKGAVGVSLGFRCSLGVHNED